MKCTVSRIGCAAACMALCLALGWVIYVCEVVL